MVVGIGLASAEAEPQCIPELHCAVARDTRHEAREARRDETRATGVHKNSMREGWWAREEAGIKLAKREREGRGEGKRRRTREGKKERKETRAQRDSPCSIETRGEGSGRMPIVFSPLGSYAAAGEKKKEKERMRNGS